MLMKDGVLMQIKVDEIEIDSESKTDADLLSFKYRGLDVAARLMIERGSFALCLRVSMDHASIFSGAFDEKDRAAWRAIERHIFELQRQEQDERAALAFDILMG